MNEDTLKTILFVEDDEFLRNIASEKLTNEGFQVVAVNTGEEVMNMIAQYNPDIILLDLLLPKMNGFEVLEQVRNNPDSAGLKVIVFSNLGTEEDLERAQSLGATEFMIKSNFTLDELIEKIQAHLA